ncbi:MAG: RNA-binding S4 domain-containing protein [Rhodanobacteraceae bacterium]
MGVGLNARQNHPHPNPPLEGEGDKGIRIDAWLWAARFFKTRALAKQAAERGRVEIGGAVCKPSHPLRIGDALRIVRGDEIFGVEVTALAHKRGSAALAQTLYRETEASRAAREAAREKLRGERAGYQPPTRKPDKRARRLIRALGDIDSM